MIALIIFIMTNILFMVLSILLVTRFSKMKINPGIGYRTPKSMASAEAWESANKKCGQMLLAESVISTIILLALPFFLHDIIDIILELVVCLVWTIVFVVGMIILVVVTETHLARNFQAPKKENV